MGLCLGVLFSFLLHLLFLSGSVCLPLCLSVCAQAARSIRHVNLAKLLLSDIKVERTFMGVEILAVDIAETKLSNIPGPPGSVRMSAS